jgi:hypothetical protein
METKALDPSGKKAISKGAKCAWNVKRGGTVWVAQYVSLIVEFWSKLNWLPVFKVPISGMLVFQSAKQYGYP